LKTARRSMLRKIVGQKRAPDEDYLTWLPRVTHKAENIASSSGVRDWAQEHNRMKWNWAGHVARRPADSWVWCVTSWRDSEWQELATHGGTLRPLRPSTRRWMKWEDSLRRFCQSGGRPSWMTLAADREAWASTADEYVSWSCSAC
jgi:hypothetical protein